MYEISVRLSFAAAHRLIGYQGPCSNIHGHTWLVKACVFCDKLDNIGIAYDFKDLKALLKEYVVRFDHRLINECPPFDQINPTSENLAKDIYHTIRDRLPEHVKMKSIEIKESGNHSIVYYEMQ